MRLRALVVWYIYLHTIYIYTFIYIYTSCTYINMNFLYVQHLYTIYIICIHMTYITQFLMYINCATQCNPADVAIYVYIHNCTLRLYTTHVYMYMIYMYVCINCVTQCDPAYAYAAARTDFMVARPWRDQNTQVFARVPSLL